MSEDRIIKRIEINSITFISATKIDPCINDVELALMVEQELNTNPERVQVKLSNNEKEITVYLRTHFNDIKILK